MNCSSRFFIPPRHKQAILFLPAPRGARYDRTKWPLADPSRLAPRSRRWQVSRSPVAPEAPPGSITPLPRTRRTAEIRDGETGLASWYGHPYHGRPAANGEIYDMEKLTAAHRTLPFGTWVRVVNLTNDKTVDVRITDRGPFVENRIIDLSHAAAVAIALIGPGVARVRLDILSVPTAASGENWYAVQAGAFLDPDRAERLRASLERDFGPAHLVQRPDTPSLWRVVVGRVPSEEAAAALARASPRPNRHRLRGTPRPSRPPNFPTNRRSARLTGSTRALPPNEATPSPQMIPRI